MRTKEFIKQLDASGTEWLRFRITTHSGRPTTFTVQYETIDAGVMRSVVRYDCAHGFAHVDIMDRAGAQIVKRHLPGHWNLKQALHEAEMDLTNNWERYRAQFFGARR